MRNPVALLATLLFASLAYCQSTSTSLESIPSSGAPTTSMTTPQTTVNANTGTMEPPNRGSAAVTGTVTAASTSAAATSSAAAGALEHNGMQVAMVAGVAGFVLGM